MAYKKQKTADKRTVHMALPWETYLAYVKDADEANMPLCTYLTLILLQNRRTPLKLQGGLRKAG